MPSQSEFNQFRRLVGDFNNQLVTDDEITTLLDDAVIELTADFATPIVVFDTLFKQYHSEVVYKAAINWWWNRISELQDIHSIQTGPMTQNVSEKWQRAMEMIGWLETQYDEIQFLKIDIYVGNYSRYSKQTLRRIGGIREEDTNA